MDLFLKNEKGIDVCKRRYIYCRSTKVKRSSLINYGNVDKYIYTNDLVVSSIFLEKY